MAELVRANRGVWLLVRGMHGLEAAAVPASAPPPLCEPPGPQQGSASIEEARACLRRDSDPQRWARGPPLVLHVRAVIKDLGVSQGIGKEAKDLQAKRARVAFDRLGRVARLGLPRVCGLRPPTLGWMITTPLALHQGERSSPSQAGMVAA